jgi:repressor of nif and glnA expression
MKTITFNKTIDYMGATFSKGSTLTEVSESEMTLYMKTAYGEYKIPISTSFFNKTASKIIDELDEINEQEELSIINKLNLTELQVWEIVKEWYTEGMYPDILQDEHGHDLEEICEIKMLEIGD